MAPSGSRDLKQHSLGAMTNGGGGAVFLALGLWYKMCTGSHYSGLTLARLGQLFASIN